MIAAGRGSDMVKKLAVAVFAGALSSLSSSAAFAQFLDVPAFQAGSATFAQSLQEVSVAPHEDGGFLLAWGEFNATLGAGNRIATRRFSREGEATAPPIRIDTSGFGLYPSIVAGHDGYFWGAWDWSKVNVARALYTRRLDSRGHGSLGEIRVDTPSTGPMVSHAVAMLPTGPVYFWKQNGLWVRAYDDYGAPLSGPIRVADNTPAFEVDIEALAGGGFVVVWTNFWMTDHSWARIYGADHEPLGPAFAVETAGAVDEVATSGNGGFAVVGHANFDADTGGAAGPRGETWMRRFAADGTPLGDREVVRTVGASVLTQADAAYDSRGNLWVVWREYDSANVAMASARGRAYDANGAALGPDIVVSTDPASEIQTVALADDCFANAWYWNSKAYAGVVCLCGGEGAGCGDGHVDARCESCDDGDTIDGDGCDSNCTTSRCGNGIPAGEEQCDDGNRESGDGCDADCTETGCGNAIVTGDEQCDDGNLTDDDGCDSDCRKSGCGNGSTSGEEECDDADLDDGDGCDSDCSVSRCGNGIRAGEEQCDDGNLEDGDGCDGNCTTTACGNGIGTGAEECDDANLDDGDGCDRECRIESCGNGRVEGGEECDEGGGEVDAALSSASVASPGAATRGATDGGSGSCNPDCTLRSEHDSVVFAAKPVALALPAGKDPVTTSVVLQVQNADVVHGRENPGHPMRLVAVDGDCPEGTVSRQPDFDRGSEGVQDTVTVPGGNPATAIAEFTVSREGFAPFDHRIPQRCTLWLDVFEASSSSEDPTPDNNTFALELNVTDTLDSTHTGEDEFFVESMSPITVTIPAGAELVTKQIKPLVRRSSEIPSDSPVLAVHVTVSDGDCPAGTVGFLDFDRRAAGQQSRLMLRRGRRAKGSLGLVVRAAAFESPNDEAPRRCTILVTAAGEGDTDLSNNTTRLTLDVIDRNDF